MDRMKGKVDAYDPTRGFGFVRAEGKTFFVHNSDVRFVAEAGVEAPFLLPEWEVEFTPVQQKDDRWKAVDVVPLNPQGFTVNPVGERPTISREGFIVVAVAEDGSLVIRGKTVEPTVDATPHFKIYYLGRGTIRGFAVRLPQPTAERVFLLVNPKEEGKTIRRPTSDGLHKNVSRGSFVMEVQRDGHVLIQKLGAHMYGMDENWLALTTRFENQYDFSRELALDLSREQLEEDLVAQTPKSSAASETDANQEFIPAILKGIELLAASTVSPATAPTT